MIRTVYKVCTMSANGALIYCASFIDEKQARDKYAEQLAFHPDYDVFFDVENK